METKNEHMLIVLVYSTADSSGWVNVEMNDGVRVGEMYLTRYVISDVPVTSSVPNSPYYLLSLDSGTGTNANRWMVSTGQHGAPLPLTGAYTQLDLNTPIHVSSGSNRRTNKIRFRLLDSAGAKAVYTQAILWLQTQ
jgi:hypothetical protein